MNDGESWPLIARSVSVSSVRVTIPAIIVKARGYRSGDKVRVTIESGDPAIVNVEFDATIRKMGVQTYFTVPASAWPLICDMGYESNDAIPMSITRPSP